METNTSRKLILVRHSQPAIVPDVPSHRWRLSTVGRRRSEVLAEQLARYAPVVVVTSYEPKAIDTGRIVADVLGLQLEMAPDLHEHDRRDIGFLADEKEFESRVIRLMEHPSVRVFGCETADEAHHRFYVAIRDIVADHPNGNLVVVAHGTVMSLFVARVADLDPVPLWQSLALPSFVVLSLPDYQLFEVMEDVERDRGDRTSKQTRGLAEPPC